MIGHSPHGAHRSARAPLRLAALLSLILLALGLAACGEGSTSSTSTRPAPAQAPSSKPPRPSAQRQGLSAQRQGPSAHANRPRSTNHPRHAKTGTAAFRVRGGDNSVPNYGSEGSGSVRSQATAVLRRYLQARAGGNWGAACSYMERTMRARLEALGGKGRSGAAPHGCAQIARLLNRGAAPGSLANPLRGGLAAFRVKGEKAFALFYGPRRQQYVMPMVLEAGQWKITQIAPVPWPIDASSAGG
jgi:hypothetical protein